MSLKQEYIDYAEALSELTTMEGRIYEKRRLVEDLKKTLTDPQKGDGSYGIHFTAHAQAQIAERLGPLALKHQEIYDDVFKIDSPTETLLLVQNMKSFIITLLADAHDKKNFVEEDSKNTNNGKEFRYTVNMNKWSNERQLQFVAIVENTYIKTGFFNWVQK